MIRILTLCCAAALVITLNPVGAAAETSLPDHPITAAQALRSSVDRVERIRNDDVAWGFLGDADQVIAAAQNLPDSRQVIPLNLHVARSLSRVSRKSPSDSEASAAARSRAAEIYAGVLSADANTSTSREAFWAEGELARLYLDDGRTAEALALARRAYTAATRAQDVLAEVRFGHVLASALDEGGDRAAAIETLRRTVHLAERLRKDRLTSTSTRSAKGAQDLDHTIDAKRLMDRLLSMLLDEIEEAGSEASQVRLSEVRDLLELQRSAELEDHFGDLCLADEEATAPDEIRGAIVLYPIVLEDRVALLTGFEGHFNYARAPIAAPSLLDHIRALRSLLEKRTTRQFLRPAEHLYDALIRPIEDQIEAADVDTLVIVPDGLLRTVPFAAFHDRSRDRFLIDMKPLALVPSLRLTNPTPIRKENLSILAAGLEAATGGFERLDYTREEIAGLRDRFPTTRVLFEEKFETRALEREIRTHPFSVVHVATHGRVTSDGSDSFLLTHDGTLGLDRMSELIQTTRFRRETPLELLTLSACETAAGDEAAALGLAGVAVRAGARSALATLWPVNDEATARLIDRFYEELARPDQTRAGALQAAQRSIRQTPRFAHPGYWAPFLMISSWL